jgi:hypothetical protein
MVVTFIALLFTFYLLRLFGYRVYPERDFRKATAEDLGAENFPAV